MSALHELATEAGLELTWRDVEDRLHQVSDATLRQVLAALDLPADDASAIEASRHRLAGLHEQAQRAFVSALAGQEVTLPSGIAGRAELHLEDGSVRQVDVANGRMPPVDQMGFHRLVHDQGETLLAISPASCLVPSDVADGRRMWGVCAQLPSLRGDHASPFGDLGILAHSVPALAEVGVDLVAISPVHALFPADPGRFSPYGPSSRTVVNVLLTDPDLAGIAVASSIANEKKPKALIDWQAAIPRRLAHLRDAFASLDPAPRPDAAILAQATFDALDAHFRGQGLYGWRAWPQEYHNPSSTAVRDFARDRKDDVAFHAWLQGLAQRSLANAQDAALRAGMMVGLVTDLAVGIDRGGSDTWHRPHAFLRGLSVGAPPDPLGPEGQDWGLTTFNPLTLALDGFRAFRDTLASAMAHAGGVRIDHILGLSRIWVIPDGCASTQGCYISFPLTDLLHILAIESQRHRAIVIGEDLGTVPTGLRSALDAVGIAGMRVLWFERDQDGGFVDPSAWDRDAAAMTSTHDLPTLAGWWQGRDIDWTWRIGRKSAFETSDEEHAHRAQERAMLWRRLVFSGHAHGDAPPPEKPDRFVTAACAHVADSACELALIPLEDLAGLAEQPNLPGTIDEHPNWRRRLPQSLAALLAQPATAERAIAITKARSP